MGSWRCETTGKLMANVHFFMNLFSLFLETHVDTWFEIRQHPSNCMVIYNSRHFDMAMMLFLYSGSYSDFKADTDTLNHFRLHSMPMISHSVLLFCENMRFRFFISFESRYARFLWVRPVINITFLLLLSLHQWWCKMRYFNRSD